MSSKVSYLVQIITVIAIVNSFPLYSQPTFGNDKLESVKGIFDTIIVNKIHDFIVVPIESNGDTKDVIFDTGADLCLLESDTIYSFTGLNVNTTGSNGSVVKNKMDLIKDFRIGNASYSNVNAIRVDFPKPLQCTSEGILGCNLFKLNNWVIGHDYLVITENKIINKNLRSFKIEYRNSNRLFADLTIQNEEVNALIDYGGNFGIEFPLSYKEKILGNHKVEQYIKSRWSINGVVIDTVQMVQLDIDFCGYSLKKVPISFSEDLEEVRIGLKVLSHFQEVKVDNKKMKIQFDGVTPLTQKEPNQITFDLRDGHFIITGLNLENATYNSLIVGHEIQKLNDKSAEDFENYCDFLNWYLSLDQFYFTTIDGKSFD